MKVPVRLMECHGNFLLRGAFVKENDSLKIMPFSTEISAFLLLTYLFWSRLRFLEWLTCPVFLMCRIDPCIWSRRTEEVFECSELDRASCLLPPNSELLGTFTPERKEVTKYDASDIYNVKALLPNGSIFWGLPSQFPIAGESDVGFGYFLSATCLFYTLYVCP